MIMSSIECSEEKSILTIALNRPKYRNALNEDMMQELIDVFQKYSSSSQANIAAIVLRGNGKSFCAGGDINWMKSSHKPQNTSVDIIYTLLQTIYQCPHPVICRIHGHTIGGGIGITAASDIVAATHETLFAFSEVKLGVLPAIISLFVCKKALPASLLEVMLTGEMFHADKALSKGLLNFVGTEQEVDKYIVDKCHHISSVGRGAVRATKSLIRKIQDDIPKELLSEAISLLKKCQSSPEGQEGLAAFLEKRKPSFPTC